MVHVKIELINQTTRMVEISIKILEVNFGNSILDNTKWDEISNSVAKNPYLEQSKTENNKCKKIIVNNHTLFSKF